MKHRTTSARNGKPGKPRPDFPLFAHQNGQWAKKIRGKLHYFGLWADPEAALNTYLDQKDALHAGRTPRPKDPEGLTIRQLVNHFLSGKRLLVESGEITARTWADYYTTCERIGKAFGLTRLVDDLATDDFTHYRSGIAKAWGPVAVGNEIQRVRSVFKHGYDAGLIDKPMRYGPGFKRPSKKTIRKVRNEKGPRMFEPDELRALIDGAMVAGRDGPELVTPSVALRAMILLGINCGFGNADCGTLPIKALDLEGGWVNYPRPKTGIKRQAKLWPETIEALREALAKRPKPKSEADANLVFITKYGTSWYKTGVMPTDDKEKPKNMMDKPISKEMAKVLERLGINRPGLGFYALRHTFETIGGESRDQAAVDHIMGHARDDMASVYRERISDERLQAVANIVRKWLFPPAKKDTKKETLNATDA